MSLNHPRNAPFWLLFLVDRDLELLFVTAYSHKHINTLKTFHHPMNINKSIAVSAFEEKIDECYDWLDFQLEILDIPKIWCVVFSLHIGMLKQPSRHCLQLLTLQGRPNFSSIFTLKSLLRISDNTTTKRNTTKLSNRALHNTNFISSDYPGRYRFVLCLNKWKSINVVYGLLLRTSFPILSAANILFC